MLDLNVIRCFTKTLNPSHSATVQDFSQGWSPRRPPAPSPPWCWRQLDAQEDDLCNDINARGGHFSSTDAAAALHSRKRFEERSNEQLSRWEMSRWELWCTEAMGSWADVGSWELWESRRWAQAAHWEESSCNSWDVLLGSVANLSTFFIHLTLICLLVWCLILGFDFGTKWKLNWNHTIIIIWQRHWRQSQNQMCTKRDNILQ